MAGDKKKGGMAGKHHPKDDNGQTALSWAHSMRKRYPPPDGCKIKVKFPDGPTGGTWGKTKGQFRAFAKNGKSIGTFQSWSAARKALQGGSVNGTKPRPKRKAFAVSEELVEALTGEHGRDALLVAADNLDEQAKELVDRANKLRTAAEAL